MSTIQKINAQVENELLNEKNHAVSVNRDEHYLRKSVNYDKHIKNA